MLTWIKYLDRVLRGEATRPSALRQGEIGQPVGGLAVIAAVLGVIYGVCMGCYALFQVHDAPLQQIIAAMIKVPALFFLTLAVTFPSLYVFNAMVGSRLSALSVLRLLVISLAVMLTVLASLGPIVAFFSASTTSYPFMLLLNVAVFAVSGFLGLRTMLVTLQRLTVAQAELQDAPAPDFSESVLDSEAPSVPPLSGTPATMPPQRTPVGALATPPGQVVSQNVRTVFRIWIIVFGMVGAQMGWVLRPFLGAPGHEFSWFRARESSFYEGVFYALQNLFR
jgi:hypothetical protein